VTLRAVAWSAAVDLGIVAAVVFGWGLDWRGEWKTAASQLMIAPFLLGPFIACVAAWAAFQQQRLATLVAAGRRPFLSVARAGALAWAWAMLAWTVMLVGTSIATAVRVGSADLGGLWPAFLMAPVALACYSAIGAAAGRLLPYWLTVVLVGPLLFGIWEAMGEGWVPGLLDQGPDSPSLAGFDWDATYLLEQTVGVLAVTALACLLPAALVRRSPRDVGSAAVVTVVVVVASSLVGTDLLRGEVVESPQAVATACVGRSPVVCVAPEHGWIATRVRAAIEPDLRQLQMVGVRLPSRFAELYAGSRRVPRAGAIFFDIGGTFGPGEAAGLLTDPGACPAFESLNHPPADRVFDAQWFIKDWLLVHTGHRPDIATDREYDWLHHASSDQQDGWVRTTYDRLRTCRLAAVQLPTMAAKK